MKNTARNKGESKVLSSKAVERLYQEYRRLSLLVVEARNQMEDSIRALQDVRQERNEALEKYYLARKHRKTKTGQHV